MSAYPVTWRADGMDLGEWDGQLGPSEVRRLDDLGKRHGTNKASWDHGYLDLYEVLFRPLDVRRVLELGVHEGASLKTWRDYWPEAEVVGVDVNAMPDVPGCVQVRGDCTDRVAMNVKAVGGPFDVVIDDASHQTADILEAFDLFAPRVRDGGLYIIEDTLLDGGPWYAKTGDVVGELRVAGERPVVVVPGRRWVVNGDDRGLWAFVAVMP